MARYDFDADACRFLSEWWPQGRRGQAITESIRCYSPAEFLWLFDGTGLVADRFEVHGQSFDPTEDGPAMREILVGSRSYRVRLAQKG